MLRAQPLRWRRQIAPPFAPLMRRRRVHSDADAVHSTRRDHTLPPPMPAFVPRRHHSLSRHTLRHQSHYATTMPRRHCRLPRRRHAYHATSFHALLPLRRTRHTARENFTHAEHAIARHFSRLYASLRHADAAHAAACYAQREVQQVLRGARAAHAVLCAACRACARRQRSSAARFTASAD